MAEEPLFEGSMFIRVIGPASEVEIDAAGLWRVVSDWIVQHGQASSVRYEPHWTGVTELDEPDLIAELKRASPQARLDSIEPMVTRFKPIVTKLMRAGVMTLTHFMRLSLDDIRGHLRLDVAQQAEVIELRKQLQAAPLRSYAIDRQHQWMGRFFTRQVARKLSGAGIFTVAEVFQLIEPKLRAILRDGLNLSKPDDLKTYRDRINEFYQDLYRLAPRLSYG